MKKERTRLFSVLLAAVLVFGTLPVSAMGTDVADPPVSAVDESVVDESSAAPEEQSAEEEAVAVQSSSNQDDTYQYNIFFLDCGRKYYSVESIKTFIDEASAAGFNYIQLAVGNDGLRFLLNDMSLKVNGETYESDAVEDAIHAGNTKYGSDGQANGYQPNPDALTQDEMDTIIDYANSKGMGVIPCVNSPGHMDAILYAANSLTGTDCAYNRSARTIDVTNDTAVAFTQALLQKYIDYFAGKGCKLFNMGADEYANDIYTSGSMGFGNLQSAGKYRYYVDYVNAVAGMIKAAGMKPMAFNDGVYFNNNTSSGTFDTDIIICYWSNGWSGYTPMPASTLAGMGFQLVNTNGSYYWVLGKSDAQCDAAKAAQFDCNVYPRYNNGNFETESVKGTIGSMFCIWADYPGSMKDDEVISGTKDTIAAFGEKLPDLKEKLTVSIGDSSEAIAATKLGVGVEQTLTASKKAEWTVEDENVVTLTPVSDVAAYSAAVTAKAVNAKAVTAKAVGTGETTITVTDPGDPTVTASVRVSVQDMTEETITVAAGGSKTITVPGHVSAGEVGNRSIAEVTTGYSTNENKTVEKATSIKTGKQYIIQSSNGTVVTASSSSSNLWSKELLVLANESDLSKCTSLWTITGSDKNGFTAVCDGKYLNIGNDTASVSAYSQNITFEYNETGGYWQISRNVNDTSYYLNNYGGEGTNAGGYPGQTDKNARWTIYEVDTTPADTTQITFNGKTAGETTVVIGNVKYTIKVVDEALAHVDPLKIEYWITNSKPKDSKDNTFLTIAATDDDVATQGGVAVADILPQEVSLHSRNQVYWRSTMLDVTEQNNSASETELQCTQNGDDETWSGDFFTRVRYNSNDNQWEVFTAKETWVGVDTTETSCSYTAPGNKAETYTGPKNQLVAYYMEQMDIANNDSGETELKINAADWGVKGDGSGDWGYNPEDTRCTVSVQIVYEDGTNPVDTTAANLKSKTFVYYLGAKRGLGTMIFNAQQN